MVNGVKVEVKSWGRWAGEGLDSLVALGLLVHEEWVGPDLGLVLVALPPGDKGFILVLVVLGGQALSGLVDELLVGEEQANLITGSLVSSKNDVLSGLEKFLLGLGEGVGDGEGSVSVESDGSSSLVLDEESSPVLNIVGDLENDVITRLLLGMVEVSSSLESRLDVEWSSMELALWCLLWDGLEFLPALGWVLVAMPVHEEGFVLVEVVVNSEALLGIVEQSPDFLLA